MWMRRQVFIRSHVQSNTMEYESITSMPLPSSRPQQQSMATWILQIAAGRERASSQRSVFVYEGGLGVVQASVCTHWLAAFDKDVLAV